MADPFFAEDDGEFDDFYGNAGWNNASRTSKPTEMAPSNSSSSSRGRATGAAAHRSSPVRMVVASPASSMASFASVSVASTDDGRTPRMTPRMDYYSTTSARAAGRTAAASATAKKVSRRSSRQKRSSELFDGVEWESDAEIAACFVCGMDFSLVKRKHHCRKCGRVICSDCSSYWRFSGSHKKHRVCSYCNVALANQERSKDSHTSRSSLASVGGAGSVYAAQSPESSSAFRSPARSHVDDDEGGDPHTTTRRHHRGKLRASIIGVFSSTERKKRATAALIAQHQEETQAQPRDVRESQGDSVEPALFNAGDDTWFTDAVDDGEDGRQRRSRDGQDLATNMAITTALHPHDNLRYESSRGGTTTMPPHSSQNTNDQMSESRSSRTHNSTAEGRGELSRSGESAPIHGDDEEDEDKYAERPTFTGNLKNLFHRHGDKKRSKSSRKSGRKGTASSQRSANESSNSLEPPSTSALASQVPDKSSVVGARVPASLKSDTEGATFYTADVDELVVDDTPGYYESVAGTRKVTSTPSYTPQPAPVRMPRPHEVAVEENLAPVSQPISQEETHAPSGQENGSGGGLAGAIKRLFGMSHIKHEAPRKEPSTNATAATLESAIVVAPVVPGAAGDNVDVDEVSRPGAIDRFPLPTPLSHESSALHDHDQMASYDDESLDGHYAIVDDLATTNLHKETGNDVSMKHTAMGYMVPSSVSAESFRASVAGTGRSLAPDNKTKSRKNQEKKTSRRRRDTFDELFNSPSTKNLASTEPGHHEQSLSRPWPSAMDFASQTGVDRFDRVRRQNEPDEDDDSFARDLGLPTSNSSVPSSKTLWGAVRGAPQHEESLRDDSDPISLIRRNDLVTSDRTAAELPRRFHTESVGQHPVRSTIMDEFRSSAKNATASTRKSRPNSVDDYFAEFERPKEYVFDTDSGTYVSAQPMTQSRNQAALPRPQSLPQEQRDTYEYEQQAIDKQSKNSGDPLSLSMLSTDGDPRYRTERQPSSQYQQRTASAASLADSQRMDATIVDKISSLEGELQELKQLLRERVTPPEAHSSKSKSRISRGSNRNRKQSIFESDSSEEEERSRQRAVNRKHKSTKKSRSFPSSRDENSEDVTPLVKYQQRKKRKDSFAGLFEDDDDNDGDIIGGNSYEALFQIGEEKPKGEHGSDGGDSSDGTDYSKPSVNRKLSTDKQSATGRRGNGSYRDEHSDQESTEVKLSTRKKVRSSVSAQKKTVNRKLEVETTTKTTAKSVPTKKKDSIDALFDSGDEDDMARLFDNGTTLDSNTGTMNGDAPNHSDSATEDISELTERDAIVVAARSVAATNTAPAIPNSTSQVDSDEEFSSALSDLRRKRHSKHADIPEKEMASTQRSTLMSGSIKVGDQQSDVNPPFGGSFPTKSNTVDSFDSDEEFTANLSTRGRKHHNAKNERQDSRPPPTPPATFSPPDSDEHTGTSEGTTDALKHHVLATETNYADGESGHFERQASNGEDMLEEPSSEYSKEKPFEDSTQMYAGKMETMSVEQRLTDSLTDTNSSAMADTDFDPLALLESTTDDRIVETTGQVRDKPANSATSDRAPVALASERIDSWTKMTSPLAVSLFDSDVNLSTFDFSGRDSLNLDALMESSTHNYDNDDLFDETNTQSHDRVSYSDEEEGFSFEIKPKKRVVPDSQIIEPLQTSENIGEREALTVDGSANSVADFERHITVPAPSSRADKERGAVDEPEVMNNSTTVDTTPELAPLSAGDEFDLDWQRMQQEEKERRKKLQTKQRQAQREKVKKQPSSGRLLGKTGSSRRTLSLNGGGDDATSSSSTSREHGEKKKKKKKHAKSDKATGDGTYSNGHRRKSGHRKHRRDETSTTDDDTNEQKEYPTPAHNLTEL